MIQNKRDLGGIITKDGLRIKNGLLVRSANLFQAEDDDLRGISAVIDLRTIGEQKEAPDKTYGRDFISIPIFEKLTAGITHEKKAEEQLLPDMSSLYRQMMNDCTETYRAVLMQIMNHDFSSGAILWHCTEGKDRCGMTTALVLEILGVDKAVIMDDYLKTNLVNKPKAIMIRERIANSHGNAYADSVYQAYIADENYLHAAWDAMGENYISERLGIIKEEIEEFRSKVLA